MIGPETDPSLCAGFKPIYISRADVLSDGTAEQILAHNLTGAKLGCWPAKR